MATWHQQRNPCVLFHETRWTIVTDPPNDLCTLWQCETEKEAEETLARWKKNNPEKARHCYILKPGPGGMKDPVRMPAFASLWADDDAVVAHTPEAVLLDRKALGNYWNADGNRLYAPRDRKRWVVYVVAPQPVRGEWEAFTSRKAALAKMKLETPNGRYGRSDCDERDR